MTETEAKTKWCPAVRAGVYGEGAAADRMVTVNRDARFDDLAKCIGSQCMMWRWSGKDNHQGHCGLAGIPIFHGN